MNAIGWMKVVGFLVALAAWLIWTSRRTWLLKETKRNEMEAPPSENQLRWDLRHIREDVSVLVFVNSLLVWFIAFSIIFIWR